VAPGYINTPSNAGVVAGPAAVKEQEEKVAMGRFGEPEEVADVVAFLFRYVDRWEFCVSWADTCFSDESRYMTGSIVEITGGR
jgi:NAD(P)-dependent dehydrogenase (short-subunit alcohol dehydrogenase family)